MMTTDREETLHQLEFIRNARCHTIVEQTIIDSATALIKADGGEINGLRNALANTVHKVQTPGKMIKDKYDHYRCSVCGTRFNEVAVRFNYCPYCGKIMERL